MTAQRLDITLEQGADYDGFFQLDFDPTGNSAAMQIKMGTGFPYALLTLTTLNGGLLIDAPNRRVYPVISGDTIAAINAGRYAYDLKMVSPAGRARRVYEGAAYVSAEVTNITILPPAADVLTDLLTQAGYGFLWQDGSGVLLPAVAPTVMATQDGSPFVFQDGAGWLLPNGPATNPTTLAHQDGSAFAFQDGSNQYLPVGAGVLAAFQDGSQAIFQDGSTFQLA